MNIDSATPLLGACDLTKKQLFHAVTAFDDGSGSECVLSENELLDLDAANILWSRHFGIRAAVVAGIMLYFTDHFRSSPARLYRFGGEVTRDINVPSVSLGVFHVYLHLMPLIFGTADKWPLPLASYPVLDPLIVRTLMSEFAGRSRTVADLHEGAWGLQMTSAYAPALILPFAVATLANSVLNQPMETTLVHDVFKPGTTQAWRRDEDSDRPIRLENFERVVVGLTCSVVFGERGAVGGLVAGYQAHFYLGRGGRIWEIVPLNEECTAGEERAVVILLEARNSRDITPSQNITLIELLAWIEQDLQLRLTLGETLGEGQSVAHVSAPFEWWQRLEAGVRVRRVQHD